MPIKPCDPLHDESVSDILMGKWAAVVRLAETGASSVYGRLQGFRRMSRNTDCYRDPFWCALDAAINILSSDPDILYDSKPETPEGLNAVEINRLAAEVGIGGEWVFQPHEETRGHDPSGNPLVFERFLIVSYPDSRPPIKLKTWGLVMPAKRLAEHARLVQDRLRCWQTALEQAASRTHTVEYVEPEQPPSETPADRPQNIDTWLEEMIPLLKTHDSDEWITSRAAAELLKVKSSALRVGRSKNRAKYQHSQGTCGIDGEGRWWRREPRKQDVWYYLPSLSGDFRHKDAHPA